VSFLAPWFLLLGGAALVPLLIHLLRRRIGLQVEFPAARYLARAERDHSRTMRMRNLLLMLLRVMAVVLLALAAARPAARVGGAGHAPTALAIVLDNSMSSAVVENGAPLIDELKAMARAAISQASPDDRLFLVTADAAVRGGSAASVLEELERVRPYAGAGKVKEAVARAAAAVEATGMDSRQVAVLTDGQRSTWTDAARINADVPVLVWSPANAAPSNRAVVLAEARPVRWTPRGAIGARAVGTDSTTYRMVLGSRTLARGTIVNGEEAVVRAAPAERGWTAGVVELEPDELPLDNVRHFALWIGPAPSVRVMPGAGPFARNAVDVLRASERVVDGSGVAIASADEVVALPALILPPSDAVRLGAANRALERLGIPWRYGAPRREAQIARGDQIAGVTVSSRYQLLPRGVPEAETLAVVGREPWIVAGPRYVLAASPLDPESSSLPVSASFIPWMAEVLSSRLHADPGGVRFAAPGDRVARPAGVEALESATGGRTALESAAFDAPANAGTYFFVRGGRRVGALVVNAEVDESRLERWSARDLAERVSNAGARVVTSRDEWTRLAFSGTARKSIVLPLLIAVLLVLAAEAVISTTGGRAKH
jgi:hypothetical protein